MREQRAEGISPASAMEIPSEAAITRRQFVRGAAGLAAAAGLCSLVSVTPILPKDGEGVAWAATDEDGALTVAKDSVFTTEDCEYIDALDPKITMVSQKSLPYGTVIWADDDNVACCLLPCETSDPLLQVGMLALQSGDASIILDKALGHDEGFQIYDARLNSTGVVWLEADILNSQWRVCTARLSGGGVVSPQIADEGNADWDMPSLAVSGDFAFWQMLPDKNGPLSDGPSLLKRIPFGTSADNAKVVLESNGRFACDPSASASGIAAAPRADMKGTYYELTHLDADSGMVTDTLLLPASMKPTFVAYGTTGFSFAFEDIYAYGDGISNLGTYTAATGDVDGQWLHFARTPFTAPAWSGNLIFVKSTGVVAAIDPTGKTYYTIQPENATQGYGEFLASSGNVQNVVTYSNIDYTPLNKGRIHECNVRVWRVS